MTTKITKSDADWRAELTPEQYHVLREKGTERAFSGALLERPRPGTYRCAGCGAELFDSDTKFESGTGWPSFFSRRRARRVETETDRSFFMKRTEVMCARCGGHLGHVFEDGPHPTGLRYCINSASLTLDPSEPSRRWRRSRPMRELIVQTFLTLDGVMQAPGGPGEDEDDGFTQGGWSVDFWDEAMGGVMTEAIGVPFDLVLGQNVRHLRRHWPHVGEEAAASR